MNPSHNLFIIGPTGAGKSTIGQRLADHYDLRFVDIDEEMERRTGVPVTTIFALEGEAGFRARESALLDEFSQTHGLVLATGAGAVLTEANRHHLRRRGYVVWMQTSIDQQLERLQRDASRPLLAGDRRARLQAMVEEREPLYRDLADLAIPGDVNGVPAATLRCIQLIDQHWQRHIANAYEASKT